MKQVDTIVLVNNIKEIDCFYKENFNLEVLHDWESMIVYKNRLAFHQIDKLEPKEFANKVEDNNKNFNNIIIYLEVDKGQLLEDLLIKLKSNNVKIIHEIYTLPWQRIIRVFDPENNIIEIGEPTE